MRSKRDLEMDLDRTARRIPDRGRHRRHLHRRDRPPGGPGLGREGALVSGGSRRRSPGRSRGGARTERRGAGGHQSLRARHDHRHQRDPRGEGRAHRAPDDRGIRGRARYRPAEALAHVRPLHVPGDAGIPRPRAPSRGNLGADRSRRLDRRSARRGGGARDRGASGRGGRHQGGRGLLSLLVSQSRPRTANRRHHRARLPPPRGIDFIRGRSGLPRVRAHLRHRVRRLRATHRQRLPRRARQCAPQPRYSRAAPDHAVARRRRFRAPHGGAADRAGTASRWWIRTSPTA